jgi:hypothetical protein
VSKAERYCRGHGTRAENNENFDEKESKKKAIERSGRS